MTCPKPSPRGYRQTVVAVREGTLGKQSRLSMLTMYQRTVMKEAIKLHQRSVVTACIYTLSLFGSERRCQGAERRRGQGSCIAAASDIW